ncbi:hypothetical protein PsYK624_084800 [Phanerochaete sordida]|uniref:Uncharacterized protein n=1 Tax=Phanerochaete sordida TaxID=48140 RepID=A0A9P3GCM9_9APHY|nr:hypothetical protein PsYK624_084800 [Phanerochaete sordida]
MDVHPDPPPSVPAPKRRSWILPGAAWLGLRPKPVAHVNLVSKEKSKGSDAEGESIYSPRVKLTYTPPTPLPAPFPKTLAIEGLHLYIASSIFVRHTLNALYTDLAVTLQRVRVHGSQESGSLPPGAPPATRPKREGRRARDKRVSIGLTVNGIGRVSGAPTEWQVGCTYTFSPLTGLIVHHSVDTIEPAPHHALFEALGKFGLLSGQNGGKTGGVGQ